MSIAKIAGVVLGSAALVAGHGYVSGAVVDGQYYSGYDMSYHYMSDPPQVIGWSTDATDLGFVDGSSYADADIICHKNAKNGAISAEIAAGKQVELQWTAWPESHKGPVITYLANCNGDCATVDKTQLEFFKIDEKGLISGSDNTWASDNLISSNNSWTVTIPSSIAAGNYVMRHEIIALHSAGNKDGAQNYPQCLNFKVTGGGSDKPEGTLGTALYKDTDPGIEINIYQTLSSYTIPGPALYTGSSSSGSSGSGSSSAAPSPTASASASATAAPVQTSTATAYQTSTAVASVTVTGSAPAQTHVQATSSSAAASTPTASSGASTGSGSGSSSSDLTDYFNSLSADELLNVIKQTLSWLVTDKIHARDISA
ncbi:Glycosyl hydrolase family 61 [Aspergillus parasiticus SU-1]|uniref:Glycosyl hydrolase family 61 n=2 Tax=Aspergillus subgen. Circumdati TaxID=2720871 RepID=A0A0F0ILE0_ASPPU|nr:glycosyl hydrolase family 61-domain-containing protein [Aspergillus transmontanensis]KJK66713.1 Glycosyl hydrolase family 61 [Aspergillus parasiticus SU-1]